MNSERPENYVSATEVKKMSEQDRAEVLAQAAQEAFEEEPRMEPEYCYKCRFYERGTCHRYAPKECRPGITLSSGWPAQWPFVSVTGWCGEYEPRPAEEKADE